MVILCLGRTGGHSVVLVMFYVVLLLFSLPRQVWWSFCCFGNGLCCFVIVFLASAGLVVILCLGRTGGHSVVLVMFYDVLLLFPLPRQVWSFYCFGDVFLAAG